MYKLVMVDLDGTLLNPYGEVTEHTKNIIKKVQEKGVDVMIASGRPMDSIKTIAKEINSNRFFVAANGAIIYDIQKEEIIYEQYIPKMKVIEIAKICEENDIAYNIYTEETIIAQNLKHNVLYYYKENLKKEPNKRTNITLVDNILEYVKESQELKCIKITVCDENQSVFQAIIRKLRNIKSIEVLDVLHMSRKTIKQGTEEIPIEYFYTEISSQQVDKWRAIQELLPILKVRPEETICIGDNINDKMMIQNSGFGICMGQSNLEIKKIAKYVTEDNDHEGVANSLEETFLKQ